MYLLPLHQYFTSHTKGSKNIYLMTTLQMVATAANDLEKALLLL